MNVSKGGFVSLITLHLTLRLYFLNLLKSPSLPVVGELQGDLDEGVWTQILLLGKLLAEPLEVEHIDVEVIDQSARNLNTSFRKCDCDQT